MRNWLAGSALIVAMGLAMMAPATPAHALPERKTRATMVIDAIDKFILPHVATLKSASAGLATAVDAVCTSKGAAASREDAHRAFAGVVRAWAGLDFIRFGPIARAHRLERVLFWPDPRSTTSRQLRAVLAARKPELLQPAGLAGQSVAVQGLTALEILLYDEKDVLGTGADDAGVYRCALARAIAGNAAAIAAEVDTEWTGAGGFRLTMIGAGSDNPLYRDSTETARDVVKALAMGLELCRDRFLLPELTALAADPPKRVRLPFDQAGQMGAYLTAQLTALRQLFDVTGLAAYVPADKPWMEAFLPNAWNSLLADAAKLDALRRDQRGSEAHLHALRKMRFDLGGIRSIIVRELAVNAEIDMGFNELDGD